MEERSKYKYAIVRIPESSVVEFFSIIASKGFSDVSFVSHLNQVTLRADPNEMNDLTPSSSVRYEDRPTDDEPAFVPAVEPRKSTSRVSATTSTYHAKPTTTHIRNSPALVTAPKIEPLESSTSEESNVNASDLLAGAVNNDILLSNLFGKHGFSLAADWSNDVSLLQNNHDHNHHPYKHESGLQTRMKGWQREYIKEVINNGHYPTEEELKDIEQKCDLSRKQVLRFIAKRLVNPNRRPRINHVLEKKKELEEREAGGDTD